jgi:Fe-Mn family superoxide dismutase
MNTFTPIPLSYNSLPGLTEKQLSEHHGVLYTGYVKKVNDLREKLTTTDLSTANATYSDLRELKLEEGFALNGVTLHEAYFGNMTPNTSTCDGDIKALIEADFGSYEKWAAEFSALGLASRGWVVLTFDMKDKKLHNYLCDVHNQGGIWGAIPVLVLDVYEHAYFIDYATARKKYIESFMSVIDWSAVNARVAEYGVIWLRENRK